MGKLKRFALFIKLTIQEMYKSSHVYLQVTVTPCETKSADRKYFRLMYQLNALTLYHISHLTPTRFGMTMPSSGSIQQP
jgi:hypothetical protein